MSDQGEAGDEEDVLNRPLTDEELEAAFRGDPWEPEHAPFYDFLDTAGEDGQITETVYLQLSDFTKFAFRLPSEKGEGYAPFSFDGRRHMYQIYDTPAKRVLLCCARQVEKCYNLTSTLFDANMRPMLIGDLRVGSVLSCLDMKRGDGAYTTTGRVTWVSKIRKKPSVLIRTRQGHELRVARTHPVRVWGDWRPAGEIQPGDRVAAVRRAGVFGNENVPSQRIELTAFMLGNGGMTQRGYRYSGGTPLSTARFLEVLASAGMTWSKPIPSREDYAVHDGVFHKWAKEDGLHGKYSWEKAIPDWVFRLSRNDTALFLNRLWATDGHVKQVMSSKTDFVYASASKTLARQTQALMWKFGIPTGFRENQPSYICTNGDPARLAYLLRVETRPGLEAFLKIGAIGRTENFVLPPVKENNNRDTYPVEINALLRQIDASFSGQRRTSGHDGWSLLKHGLRQTLMYPPSKAKLRAYHEAFRSVPGFDAKLLEALRQQLDTDVYWDEVDAVEDLGEEECVDLEVEEHHNFLLDGVFTHNSTTMGNKLLARCCITPGFKCLYVSPSSTQTKTFSADRIKDPIETSDILRGYTTRNLSQNVFEKQFINRSKITLRYAFLNADRVRGVSPWCLAIDEFQDILADVVPVIEQSTSHAPEMHRSFIYGGTPKGFDNPIEFYLSGTSKEGRPMSTQCEWVVPCEACNFWNILGEKNIGRKGVICEKCGKLINPQHERAQWAATFADGMFEAYRINQLMVPWRKWDEILLDYSRYSRDKFYNEVLGLSFDSGMRPINRATIRDNCNPLVTMHPTALEAFRKSILGQEVYAGIDWGADGSSYTVLTLACYVGSKFRIFWIGRFEGEDTNDPDKQVAKIISICRAFNVSVIGSDYGAGYVQNNTLTREFGKRLQKFQYVARLKRKVLYENRIQRFVVHRSEVMSDIFAAIKRRNVFEFPRYEEFQVPYAQDILNIYSEYNEKQRMIVYGHRPDRPDDSFHSIIFCFLGSMIRRPRPDIITPRREIGGQPQYSWSSSDGNQG